MYTTEEIYRTDLSEVVLQMADLGITDFMNFNFISHPGKEGIIGAIDTLNMLGALDNDNNLSAIGKLMVNFPLEPRISRIIVEAIMKYPSVLEEVLIAASFLSTNSPYILPPGEEMEARRAHHQFQDIQGDFVSYLRLFTAFEKTEDKEKFCERNFLDHRVMLEIENINEQLKDIVGHMGLPVLGGGDKADYLTCIASGMIQFVCIRSGRECYKSLTTDIIYIHPGSVMFHQDPLYIVAGEIVRTSRMFAMSVSPLTKKILSRISDNLVLSLEASSDSRKKSKSLEKMADLYSKNLEENLNRGKNSKNEEKSKKDKKSELNSSSLSDEEKYYLGEEFFEIRKIKGKRTAIMDFERFLKALHNADEEEIEKAPKNLCARLVFSNGYYLFEDVKISQILTLSKNIDLHPINEKEYKRNLNINIEEKNASSLLTDMIQNIMHVAEAKKKEKSYGIICLYTDGNGNYWTKVSKGLHTAVKESIYSLETLVDKEDFFNDSEKEIINTVYRKLNSIL